MKIERNEKIRKSRIYMGEKEIIENTRKLVFQKYCCVDNQ